MKQNNRDNSKGFQVSANRVEHIGDRTHSGYEFHNVDNLTINQGTNPQQQPIISPNLDEMRPSLDCWQGRREEIEQIRLWMEDDTIRLIGITGVGGFGKSTLAAKIYEDESAEFEGKFWADVSRRVTFTELARRVLLRLGMSQPSVEAIPELSLVDALVNHLREGQYLLVIDNLESLLKQDGQSLDAMYEEFFQGWLEYGGKSKVLVTTRERPNLPEIKSRWLPLLGLQAVDGASLLRVLGILGTEVELEEFVTKAQGHPVLLMLVVGFLRKEEESDPQIRYLQKYGLADVPHLLTDEKLRGLHRGKVDIWMCEVLDASFNRLSDRLQRLLLNLSVYRLPFNTAAAVAQMPDEEISEQDLKQMVRRSLLQEERDEDGEKSFTFHPFILAYIEQKAGDLTEAHERAIKYYESRDSVPIRLEIFHHHCELKQYDLAKKDLDFAYEPLRSIGQNSLLVELYERLLLQWQPNSQENKSAVAWALTDLGKAYGFLKEYQKAIDYHHQSLAIFQEIGDRNGEASALTHIGQAYDGLGQLEQAIEYYQKTLETFRQISEHRHEAFALDSLGNAYKSLKEYQTAIDYYQQSLVIRQEIGDRCDRSGEAASLFNLGNAYYDLKEYQTAIDYYQQCVVIAREIGNRSGESYSLFNLGNAYYCLNEYQTAIDYYQQSLPIFQEIGDRSGESSSLNCLGNAYGSLKQYQTAIDYHQQSLVIKREIGDRSWESNSLFNLGNAYYDLKEYQTAIDYYQQSLVIKREIGDRSGERYSLFNLGNAYYDLKEDQTAIDYYQQSLVITREIGDCSGESASLSSLGNAYDSLKEYQQAINYYEQSLEIQREMGDRLSEAKTLQTLASLYHQTGRVQEGFTVANQATQIFQELELPIDEWNIPKWMKSIAKFAQRGKVQIALCFILGLLAFPLVLPGIILLMLWRIIRAQFLRKNSK
ncbi:MAG: tetratricopeptide repeat protein [Calothrix sp. MO_192.B10]|nr:tetratricopeptide repeat protein [Calothrix sp. MO_192.B10]